MDRRDGLVGVGTGLLAALPVLADIGCEAARVGCEVDGGEWLAPALLLGVAPFLLAFLAARPAAAGLVAGAVLAVAQAALVLVALQTSGSAAEWLRDYTGLFVTAAAFLVLGSVGLGVLAGTWAAVGRQKPIGRWVPWGCLLALLYCVFGFSFQLGPLWLVVGIAAVATAIAAWRRPPDQHRA